MSDEIIKINLLEVASELAHTDLQNHYEDLHPYKNEDELHTLIYNKDEEGSLTYKEEAQNLFNGFYTYYFTTIDKLKEQ